MEKEVWKWLNKEKKYKVSNTGKVLNVLSRKSVNPILFGRGGYTTINLQINNKKKTFLFHRLIASLFIKNNYNKPCINHIDGNKSNNTIKNLEWVTYKENTKNATDRGVMKKVNVSREKLDDIQVLTLYTTKETNPSRSLEKLYKIHQVTVARIRRGCSYKELYNLIYTP